MVELNSGRFLRALMRQAGPYLPGRRSEAATALILVGGSWAVLLSLLASGLPFARLLILALFFGGVMSSIYPLCVAETFDRLERRYYVAASGRMLMIHSIGATLGPLSAAVLMAVFGPFSFFVFEAAVALLYAMYVLMRVYKRPATAMEQKEKFVPLPDAAPIATDLDPRCQEEDGKGC